MIVNSTTYTYNTNNNNINHLNNHNKREYLDCIFTKGKFATSSASSNSNNKQFKVIPNDSLLSHNKEHQ